MKVYPAGQRQSNTGFAVQDEESNQLLVSKMFFHIFGNICRQNVYNPQTVSTYTNATMKSWPSLFPPYPNLLHGKERYSDIQVRNHLLHSQEQNICDPELYTLSIHRSYTDFSWPTVWPGVLRKPNNYVIYWGFISTGPGERHGSIITNRICSSKEERQKKLFF